MERAFQPADLDRIQGESPVRVVQYYRQLPSTSDRALQLARVDECETPLVVLAELQTAGRGRGHLGAVVASTLGVAVRR